jgi:hypothetical protein
METELIVMEGNASMAYLKMEDWTNGVAMANKALEKDSSNIKALYRRLG